MKRYVSGFLFFCCLTMFCLFGLFWMTRGAEHEEARKVQVTESLEEPLFADGDASEIPKETMAHLVLNQTNVSHEIIKEKYCLVAEEGYLIVYDTDKKTVNLFTHMPLAEFPMTEQERLMEGIWFPTMAEIFSYLESYSS